MLQADTIAAQRQTRRSLRIWRILAVVAVIFGLIALVAAASSKSGGLARLSDHVARIEISGLITGDRETLDLLEDLRKADRVKAVIVRIDSPGGTTAGSEAIYLALREVAAKKPVVSVMDTVAASGGYITALATDHVVARGNTITGSIGVIFQWAQISKLFENVGIEMQNIRSGELKAQPNMFDPMSEKVRKVTEEMVQDSYKWFAGLVKERRKLPETDVTRLSDGRVYTGRQALKEKLIDAVGGEDEALDWLRKERKIEKSLEIVDWQPEKAASSGGLGLRMGAAILDIFGLGRFAGILAGQNASSPVVLDGLMAVWHPALRQGTH